ncbi:peptidoglycan-associated lipoprotein Pal [Candidatus Nitronereus thalassa]|uniref:Peptidoglycan-associated lipoprotein n=1 Tax=Candidatus Nitronereus thalassa TaxID=3020898 RepID=A0ABU3K616_9BACT|nr:peptidoglycan-associated lipoprotein Pal [Candidatus Nitronereus thalassa]MDT7041783.1 peptidoglycan-associated lipoprotein Pal [Candidatus Nitronereus thalassa]
MSKGKSAAAFIVAAAAMMMFFTGCETTKHAEVMSAEELARKQAALQEAKSSGSEQGGIPLTGQGLSEGSIAMDGGSETETADSSMRVGSDFVPQGPPLPTLRGEGSSFGGDTSGESTIADMRETGGGMAESSPPPTPSGSADSIVESSPGGPSGYEGQQFVQGLTPSDFVPEGPPQPNLGHAPFTPDLNMGSSGSSDSGTVLSDTRDSGEGMSGSSGAGDEVVQVPDHSGTQDTMEPLGHDDMGGHSQEVVSSDGGMELEHVYFDFDQYVIRPDAVSTLQANAQLLNGKYENSSVLIEGHCDERGTRDYNLVLGERRAQAVKNYLTDLGVSPSRIRIVSYGKERPSCSVSQEWCWQKNRRGHIVVQ